jgi:putative ABC transport system permease protein
MWIAMRALTRNKMRSFLTMLGVIIGVAAVIAMVAIGEGAKANVEASFAAMGTNLLVVMPGAVTSGGVSAGGGSRASLTWDDLTAIQNELSTVKAAAPQLRVSAQIVTEEQNWSTSVYGTTPDYFLVRSWPVSSGSSLQQSDVDTGTKVIVLGATVASKLFGEGGDPVGQFVRIRNIPFQVIGVAGKKGQSSTGQDFDDCAFIPDTTFMQKIQGGLQKYLNGTIYVAAQTPDDIPKLQTDLTSLLRQRHKLLPGDDDDFTVRNLAEIADAQAQGTQTLTSLLAAVAAVSLAVGGIGIMNIMLVSVTERTREIGVRMAIGAKPRHILAQFLAESLTLSMVGGFAGVAGGAFATNRVTASLGWPTLLRPEITFIAVGFSAGVGILFGLYPAWKASKLDPIQALRFE